MVAQLNATDLLQYTHTAQVENWKGTMLSFILHYQEQIRLYDQLQPPNKQTSDHVKMIYLQNAVHAIEELRLVQTTESQLALANGTVPMYKDYKAFLKLAASTYDRAHAPAKCQPTRSAECTDIWDANITESFHEAYEFGFDIDTPTDIVQAHMHDQSGVIPKETFGRLSPESRKAWSQLSDDVRVDILQALQANGSQRFQESTRTPSLHDKPRYNRTRVPQNAMLKVEPSPPLPNPMYDEYGEFRGHVLINQREWQVHYFDALDTKPSSGNNEFHDALEQFADDPDSIINLVVYPANHMHYICDHETVEAAPKFVMTSEPDYGQLRPCLGWLPVDAIKKTFKHTTQLTCMPMSTILKKQYKSPNPALNVCPRDEPVATDTIFSDTPAIGCGITSAQLFVGTKTHTADVYPIKSNKQFVKKLLDNITQRGAPTKLISDHAQVEISEHVKQVLLTLTHLYLAE
jgi:hypothetical protein